MSSTPIPAASPAKKSRLRRILRGAKITILSIIALGLLWLLTTILLRKERGSALWTEQDLPELPPLQQNGWIMVQNQIEEYGRIHIPVEFTDLQKLDQEPEPRRWDLFLAHRNEVDTFLKRPAMQRHLITLNMALDQPYFKDACPISLESQCQTIELLNLVHIASWNAMDLTVAQPLDRALSLNTKMLHAFTMYLGSARSLVTHFVAMNAVKRNLVLLGTLLTWVEQQHAAGRIDVLPESAFAGIRNELDQFHVEEVDLERGIKVDYIFFVHVLDEMSRIRSLDRLLLDPGRTLADSNAYYTNLVAFAREPKTTAPPEHRLKAQGFGWWLINPIGKMLIDTTRLDVAPTIGRFNQERSEVAILRDQLHDRLSKSPFKNDVCCTLVLHSPGERFAPRDKPAGNH